MEKKSNTLKNCCIEFDNRPDGIYHAGETVSGTVNITMKGSEKYKGIILRVKGWATVRWRESRSHGTGKRRSTRSVTFTSTEVYFKTYNDLIQPQDNDALAIEYTSGVHKFTFSFSLPTNLPCSFVGDLGSIQYETKVTVKRPYKSDSCYRALFTVISSVNLNYKSAVKVPHSISKSKNFYFLFSKQGTFNLTVTIPLLGYTCGQVIQAECILNNQSKIKMEQLKVSLVQDVIYIASSPYHKMRARRQNVLTEYAGKMGKMEEKIKNVSITLPFLPLSSQNYCSIISVRYLIKVKAKMEGVHDNIKCEFPIIIGSIPLTEIDLAVPAIAYDASQPTTSHSVYIPTPIRTMEPPSYEEAMMMSGPSQGFKYGNA